MTDPDDRDGQPCTKCGIGYYDETSIHDDWDGVLHCTNRECNYEVKRYKSKDNFEPEPDRVAKLSPPAQSVLDAYENTIGYRQGFAAVIRKLANQLDHATSAHTLYAIADELEGAK